MWNKPIWMTNFHKEFLTCFKKKVVAVRFLYILKIKKKILEVRSQCFHPMHVSVSAFVRIKVLSIWCYRSIVSWLSGRYAHETGWFPSGEVFVEILLTRNVVCMIMGNLIDIAVTMDAALMFLNRTASGCWEPFQKWD